MAGTGKPWERGSRFVSRPRASLDCRLCVSIASRRTGCRRLSGGTAEHDTIGNNLRVALHAQMRGKPCRTHGPDLKVKAGKDGRYPDALIDCGPRVTGALHAQEPVAVFEVLSKSTGWIDQSLKLRDYDATPTIRIYVLISQDELRAMVYSRDADGRLGIQSAVLIEGMEASIELSELGLTLPFSDLYEGLDLGFAAATPR
jgi:Uma2 family endonuclease